MRIPGQKKMRQMARWLRSRFVGGALILGYHRVTEAKHDPYTMCVRPAYFAEQLAVLRQYTHVFSLRELAERLQQGTLPQRAVALTFDDGYADNLFQAWPLLEHYEAPATVFVTTGYLGRAFWWDELAQAVFSPVRLPASLRLRHSGQIIEWQRDGTGSDKDAQGARCCLLWLLYQRLSPLPADEREQLLAHLRAWAGIPLEEPAAPRALRPVEIVQLADGGLVEIGAHTVTHPILTSLPPAGQQAEIEASKSCLEELLGQPVYSFSYPNGAASAETKVALREAGLLYACASQSDVIWRGSDSLCLPRFWIPNWDGEQFARWLRRWLPG